MLVGSDRIETWIFEEEQEEQEIHIIPNSEKEIIANCKNLNITKTAYCLRDEIEPFFKFNSTDDKMAKNMTLNEIKEFGGDCTVYAYLYERLGKELGFNSTTLRYNGIKGIVYSHRWALIWDDEINCKLNQLEVVCKKNE